LDTLHISAFRQETARKSLDMVIVGVKQPLLAFELLQHARKMNLRTVSISQLVTRDRFLEILGSARLALLLPLEQEGFYLPALEAMGTNTLVICPDCIGNRSFCRNGMNALVPDYSTEGIILMLKKAIQMSTTDISSMLEAAMATFHQHDLNFEREQFHWILDHADDLWKDAPDKQQ
jgi:glycosyltransferase involved in cell wall biosynthesis